MEINIQKTESIILATNERKYKICFDDKTRVQINSKQTNLGTVIRAI